MCIIHLFNTSIIHIFYTTQVLRIVQIFFRIFDKNFSLHNMLHLSLFYFPKSIPKNFQNFSFAPFKTLTSHIRCLKLAIAKVFLLSELLASVFLL